MNPTLELTQALIALPSLTPTDAGCQTLIADQLEKAGFQITHLPQGKVSNLWAIHGKDGPLLALAGHTDVVAPGPREAWHSEPYSAVIRDNRLYGRGVADMKGSLAAMITAGIDYVTTHPDHPGQLAYLITSGEEGDDFMDGTPAVLDYLQKQGITLRWCLIGEPSSLQELGDNIRIGRRGSLTGRLSIHGRQGHVAYPQLADNPIHRASRFASELIAQHWDEGDDFFPATTLQISHFQGGDGSTNVIPAQCDLIFNFRYSPASPRDILQTRVEALLAGLNYDLKWTHSGDPFFTTPGKFSEVVCASVHKVLGRTPKLSTCGGTSDGRFIAKTGADIIELGLVNQTIHQINENVSVADITALQKIYYSIIETLL
jgi:succinyl-diaminopimelate desuccinylase